MKIVKISKELTLDKHITPVINKERTIVEKYEVCPYCNQEIREKSTYVDQDNYKYHRPCIDNGPIDYIEPFSDTKLKEILGW
jgi:uncharacterized protein with PIN domain